ncbi:MAG: glycosyltransferase family 4 protein [Nitrososphaerota archaeon]|nr:glycosyltransferase family 4 protein [Nitrososphaerota archaeon]
MKIAQVNVYYDPFFVGGAEWYVYNISRRLAKMGHEVHVFTARKYQGKDAPEREDLEGVIVHRFPFKLDLSYRLKIWNGLADAIALDKFDIIHTYDYAQSHTNSALRAAKKTGTPVALTVFDIHTMIPRPFYKQMWIKLFEAFSAKKVLLSANKLLVRAPTLIGSLQEIGVPLEKIIVTPSGINEDSLKEFDGRKFLSEHVITGSPVILFLGRLNPLKGPQHILNIAPDIVKQFPDAAFVFVGPDQSGYSNELNKMAKDRKIKAYFTGPIYDLQKKMQAYASCDLFVLPTTYEGTSQAIFEAMSQARPIVSTSVGGIPSQIKSGREGLLVEYGDESALREAALDLLTNRKKAEALGQAAREKVKSFTYPVLASRLEEIYENLVQK